MVRGTDGRREGGVDTRAILLPEICLVSDLAIALGRSEEAVRALIRRGRIPARKLGRTWVVPRAVLLRCLAPDDAGFRLLTDQGHQTGGMKE